jgi:hypothetical protein
MESRRARCSWQTYWVKGLEAVIPGEDSRCTQPRIGLGEHIVRCHLAKVCPVVILIQVKDRDCRLRALRQAQEVPQPALVRSLYSYRE